MRILFFLFLSIHLMGQTPPRVTFKQLQKDTLTGSIAISGLDSNLTYSRDFYISADSFLILYGDTVGQGSLNSILVDGVTILGDGVNTNLSADTNLIKDIIGAMVNAGLGIDITYDPIDKELLIESLSLQDYVKNGTGSSIPKGTPLYVTGVYGNFWEVAPADASDANKMPVVAIAGETIGAGAEGIALIKGHIKGVNTAAFTAGDEVYVAPGGGYTNVRPKGETNLVQFLGTVVKADANGGGIINLGEVEQNLNPGRIFIGGADSTITRVTLNDSISSVIGDSLALNVVRSITAGTFLSGNTITSTGTIALDTASAGLKTYISENSSGGSSFNNISEDADTVFVSKFLNVDTSTLFVNAVNNRVGIGTTSPSTKLHSDGTITAGVSGGSNGAFDIKRGSDGLSVANFFIDTDNSIAKFNTAYSFYTFSTEGVERMRISTGNVGIGTTTPIQKLDVSGAIRTANFYQISNGSTNVGFIGSQASIFGFGGDDFTFFNGNATSNVFYTNGSERMRIDASGNLGLGTTSPSYDLHVVDDIFASDSIIATTVTQTSDARLKTDIDNLDNGLILIQNLNPVTYRLIQNENNQNKNFGFIAQEVESFIPSLVSERFDGMKVLNYIDIIPITVKAIQEQQAIIETQKQEIDQLKTQYETLLQRIIQLENK